MSSTTWRYLAGDTASFAIEFALVRDTADDWMVDADERASWGSFAVWAGGVNVCESNAHGEQLQSAHWYLLPIVEWLLTNWDPLLHEERLPRGSLPDAAARAAQRSALLAEFDFQSGRGFGAADAHQEWVARHRLRSSAPGALLPDLYLRRYGDAVEFSCGADRLPGDEWGVTFAPIPPTRVPVEIVSDALEEALAALVHKLVERHPDSVRILALQAALTGLASDERYAHRFAWLSGAGAAADGFLRTWAEVAAAMPGQVQELLRSWRPERIGQRPYLAASPVSLLFGSLSPAVSIEDVQRIFVEALRAPTGPAFRTTVIDVGRSVLNGIDVAGLSPGEAGSVYGDEAWVQVGNGTARRDHADRVDVAQTLRDLGVWVRRVALDDTELRAVSVLTEGGSAGILVNLSYGQRAHGVVVDRFTLAHELAHLLLDQGRARQLLVASGPWAPAEIEKRANAFAAAFLMPIPILQKVVGQVDGDLGEPEVLGEVARALDVSYSALVSRCQNLGWLSSDQAEVLRDRTR